MLRLSIRPRHFVGPDEFIRIFTFLTRPHSVEKVWCGQLQNLVGMLRKEAREAMLDRQSEKTNHQHQPCASTMRVRGRDDEPKAKAKEERKKKTSYLKLKEGAKCHVKTQRETQHREGGFIIWRDGNGNIRREYGGCGCVRGCGWWWWSDVESGKHGGNLVLFIT